MFKCEICGREIFKKNRLGGYTLCSKHMHQFFKYGKFLDNIQRTNQDLNDFRWIDKNIIEFDVYYQNNTYCDSFIIDAEDLKKVQFKKWRKDSNNRIITGNCTKNNPRRELSHIIMNVSIEDSKNTVIDHINGNTKDNRKNNLRICSQSENVLNKHFMTNNKTGFIGIYYSNSKERYVAEIKRNKVKCYLGQFKKIEEAIYVRYVSELLVFKDFRANNNDENIKNQISQISTKRKEQLYARTVQKLNRKNMIEP